MHWASYVAITVDTRGETFSTSAQPKISDVLGGVSSQVIWGAHSNSALVSFDEFQYRPPSSSTRILTPCTSELHGRFRVQWILILSIAARSNAAFRSSTVPQSSAPHKELRRHPMGLDDGMLRYHGMPESCVPSTVSECAARGIF